MRVQFLSTNVLLRKLAFCKEVIHYLDSEAKNGLKIEEKVFMNFYFAPVHKISLKSDDGNSVKQQLSKLEFGIFHQLLLWQKKPKATNALFEWFRLKIKGATLETNSCFLKMVILKIFFQTQNQLF